MINKAVAWHTFQQHHWIRLSLLGVLLLLVFLTSGGYDRNLLIGLTPFVVWLLGSGTIGRDMASGVNHLLFTRPISRREYIITKWASLSVAVIAFQVVIFLTWVLGKLVYHSSFGITFELLQDFGIAIWVAIVLSPVVVCFSTIMSGWGDLALLLYVHVVVFVMRTSASNSNEFVTVITNFILRLTWPGAKTAYHYVDSHLAEISYGDFVFDSAVAGVYLFSAIYLMNRKNIGNMST